MQRLENTEAKTQGQNPNVRWSQAGKLQAGMRECLIFRPKSEFQSVSIRKSVPERSFLDFCSRFIKKETQLKAGRPAAAAARASLSTCSTLAPLSHHASSNAPDSSDWTSCQVLRFSATLLLQNPQSFAASGRLLPSDDCAAAAAAGELKSSLRCPGLSHRRQTDGRTEGWMDAWMDGVHSGRGQTGGALGAHVCVAS